MPELPSQYDPKEVEESRYRWWESSGFFQAAVDSKRKPYTIVIPPPNVTGILHMGHALNNTLQDILIRWKRMQGFGALWIPGTDHAGIATQNVVEKTLAKEGKRRQDLGREVFVERVWDWKREYGDRIIYQLKRLGSSCDWKRTRFTMDEGLSEAVASVFVDLYDKGLVYRGHYIINWCPRCQTALSDEEAPRQETHGKLYHIKYPLAEGSKLEARGKSRPRASSLEPPAAFIEVATTRPETMLGDAAIAVHPKDKRYQSLIGKEALLPLVHRKLPIIADAAVDRDFGTGAVKVTPAHDPVDFQLGKKHKLEFRNVMTDDARMTNVPAAYEGLDRFDCRSKLIVDLEREGLLGAIDEHVHNVGRCYRCQTVVEPRLSPQWFVKMKPLAEPAIKAVKGGSIRFVPARWTKVYLNWMENIEDWCISRQIWWGHRLPVYYCRICVSQGAVGSSKSEVRSKSRRAAGYRARTMGSKGVVVSKVRPAKCPDCGSADLKQDEDVLDTWFSSWLWPFSTLGWPKKTKDLSYFYPTDTLVTAQEIIFFWVARMIMAGFFCVRQKPFSRVYIHGTVRDLTGKKMSKSLGNIIDPLEIIDRYGTDALRYTLVTATAIGQDIFLSEERFAAGRNFANKLWNATRFVLSAVSSSNSQVSSLNLKHETLNLKLTVADRWILSRLQRTIEKLTDALEGFAFSEAASTLYDFLWHDFCDWYLEIAKVQLAASAKTRVPSRAKSAEPAACSHVLIDVLETSLRLLHPFMPFVTEELWQHLRSVPSYGFRVTGSKTTRNPKPETRNSIMVTEWPKPSKALIDSRAESDIERLRQIVGEIRNTRSSLNFPLNSHPRLALIGSPKAIGDFFRAHENLLQSLAGIGAFEIRSSRRGNEEAAKIVADGVEMLLYYEGLIDVEEERSRITQKIEALRQRVERLTAQMGNTQFTAKAPKEVVEQTRSSLAQAREELKKFEEHLAALQTTR